MVLIDNDGWQDCCVRSLLSYCEFCSWQSVAGSFSSCVKPPELLRHTSQYVAFVIGTFQTRKSLGICIWRTCFTNLVNLRSDLNVLGKVFVNASVVSSFRLSFFFFFLWYPCRQFYWWFILFGYFSDPQWAKFDAYFHFDQVVILFFLFGKEQ